MVPVRRQVADRWPRLSVTGTTEEDLGRPPPSLPPSGRAWSLQPDRRNCIVCFFFGRTVAVRGHHSSNCRGRVSEGVTAARACVCFFLIASTAITGLVSVRLKAQAAFKGHDLGTRGRHAHHSMHVLDESTGVTQKLFLLALRPHLSCLQCVP